MVAPLPGTLVHESYETRGIALDRGQIEPMAAESDWEQRTFLAFDTSTENGAGYDRGGPMQSGATLTETLGPEHQTTVLYFGSLTKTTGRCSAAPPRRTRCRTSR